jgi:hypothetical protein
MSTTALFYLRANSWHGTPFEMIQGLNHCIRSRITVLVEYITLKPLSRLKELAKSCSAGRKASIWSSADQLLLHNLLNLARLGFKSDLACGKMEVRSHRRVW